MAWRSRTSSWPSKIALLAILLGCGGSTPSAIAELMKADGPVDRQEAAGEWKPAGIGTRFFLGDAAKTADGAARLKVGSANATIAMQPHTVLRFGGRIVVETGGVELTGTGTYSLEGGDVKLSNNGTLRITAKGGGKSSIELTFGAAQITREGNTVDLQLGQSVELGFGAVVVTTNIDAGVPDAAPAIDAGIAAPAAELVEVELKGRVEAEVPGEKGWKVLPPDTKQLAKGTRLRLGGNATAKLVARGTTLELGGGARAAIEDDLGFSIEAGPGRAQATAGGAVKLPGGAIALPGSAAGAASEARVDVGARETRVAMLRGGGTLSGAPGTDLAMTRGESATLGRGGTIRVLEAIPAVFDLRVPAGESLTVHDPRPPVAVQFRFGDKCPDGGIIELDRDPRFRTPRVSAGKEAANLRVENGAWAYRLRCSTGGGEGAAVATGRIAVLRDSGTRALPKIRPPNDIEVDGRTWRVSYQSVMPDLRVQARGTGAAFRLNVAQGGRAETYDSPRPVFTIPGAKLREGTYTYWIDIDGVKQDKVSTLIINFDQTAAQVYIEAPQNGAAWAGDIEVRGAVLPGWTAAVEAVQIPIDRQRRFIARVGAPPGAALAIKLSHPQRGIHYYLRRAK